MTFNPFLEKTKDISEQFLSWKDMAVKPYDKEAVSPYTKTRVILMNGTEYESVYFSHNFSRHCENNDIRRAIATTRRNEQQQQKMIAGLKPIDENQLETTIAYEQLAVDLTSFLAQRATNEIFKSALDFALLEDFDHLYRYADLLDFDFHIKAEKLVGKYTEIMPGRPTVAHHRHPADTIRPSLSTKKNDLTTLIDTHIITAAEQQTMNYYMNLGAFYHNEKGRKLYTEIGMVEEDHVTHYGSLTDSSVTFLECNLVHEYVECYLYYSMMLDESDPHIKKIWERCLDMEISHLHSAEMLLKTYEKKTHEEVLNCDGTFIEPLKLQSNIDYVRDVLRDTVHFTSHNEGYEEVKDMKPNSRFFKYQETVTEDVKKAASHNVISDYLKKNGIDYRFETKENPIPSLRDRKVDNIDLGRVPNGQ